MSTLPPAGPRLVALALAFGLAGCREYIVDAPAAPAPGAPATAVVEITVKGPPTVRRGQPVELLGQTVEGAVAYLWSVSGEGEVDEDGVPAWRLFTGRAGREGPVDVSVRVLGDDGRIVARGRKQFQITS